MCCLISVYLQIMQIDLWEKIEATKNIEKTSQNSFIPTVGRCASLFGAVKLCGLYSTDDNSTVTEIRI